MLLFHHTRQCGNVPSRQSEESLSLTTIGTACPQVEVAIKALEAKAAALSRELGVRQTRGALSTLSRPNT